ncbi:amidohydrolase family protein [Ktedonosporobacter rubrisoli]|uniref:Amidohydrolase family protein n=1 Tax=Ktedonosporobacter rubrisoli TaxID=2509675 RepID=A0A4P6K069_KTERU|nr:amidohydrolase family protein [Ktedonosporobacter rubrisoli]QBD81162.1 amidohydrolase family protein [Ktedonosporobacter rubrisoli]
MKTFMISNTKVFDGRENHPAQSVTVQNGKIMAIGTSAPEVTEVIDGTGCTLLPGLIDAHTHIFPEMLEQAFQFGVTTELDMFSNPRLAKTLKAAARTNKTMADLRFAGTGATAPGGHPTGLVAQGFYPPFPTISAPEEAEQFVRDRVAEGSDYLKLIIDGGDALGYGSHPTLDDATLAALVRAAHEHGLLAIAHTDSQRAIRRALQAGVDGLAHCFIDGELEDDLLETIVKAAVFIMSTLAALEAICGTTGTARMLSEHQLMEKLNPPSQQMVKMAWPQYHGTLALEPSMYAVKALHDAGIKVLAGSDAGTLGVAHGASLHRELALLVQAGLTPIEALRAATSVPAAVFQLQDRGRIHKGFLADLLLVTGNPLENIADSLNIKQVWRG